MRLSIWKSIKQVEKSYSCSDYAELVQYVVIKVAEEAIRHLMSSVECFHESLDHEGANVVELKQEREYDIRDDKLWLQGEAPFAARLKIGFPF